MHYGPKCVCVHFVSTLTSFEACNYVCTLHGVILKSLSSQPSGVTIPEALSQLYITHSMPYINLSRDSMVFLHGNSKYLPNKDRTFFPFIEQDKPLLLGCPLKPKKKTEVLSD